MYPSHYAKGEYGLKNPNRQPYLIIHHGVQDALTRLGGKPGQLRPFLQDFSLGVRYTPAFVRAQIRAAEELGVRGWILWNPGNHYDWSAVQAGPIEKPAPELADAPKKPSRAKKRAKAADAPAAADEPSPLPSTPPAEAKPADAGSDTFAPAAAPSPEAPPTPEVH
jgi:hypothetical protein